jgi:hypothetical protein
MCHAFVVLTGTLSIQTRCRVFTCWQHLCCGCCLSTFQHCSNMLLHRTGSDHHPTLAGRHNQHTSGSKTLSHTTCKFIRILNLWKAGGCIVSIMHTDSCRYLVSYSQWTTAPAHAATTTTQQSRLHDRSPTLLVGGHMLTGHQPPAKNPDPGTGLYSCTGILDAWCIIKAESCLLIK